MSVHAVTAAVLNAAVLNSGWAVFWVQLPLLILAVTVIIVATTALWRARPEDVPRVFEAFAAAFGRRPGISRKRSISAWRRTRGNRKESE
ncbi:hypothetical protein ACFYO1_01880 [Nocardia sp. NPDC006044]|uniref:hypothetical protein n=1 Tax=Nocardia sp. NPDC006044 TaxID=3364306 RepID=UPI0036AA686F